MIYDAYSRIKAYEYCIRRLKKYYPSYVCATDGPYLCSLLICWARRQGPITINIKENFPEFYSCKPVGVDGGAWFGDESTENILIRLMVLQYCIEVCENEIRCATA